MATRMSLKKSIRILSVFIAFIPTHLLFQLQANPPKANFKRPYLHSEREIKFHCLFMFSIKRQIRHFHVVVVQKRERNVQKCDAHAKLLFCSLNLLFLWRFRCQPRRWILKSLILELTCELSVSSIVLFAHKVLYFLIMQFWLQHSIFDCSLTISVRKKSHQAS